MSARVYRHALIRTKHPICPDATPDTAARLDRIERVIRRRAELRGDSQADVVLLLDDVRQQPVTALADLLDHFLEDACRYARASDLEVHP